MDIDTSAATNSSGPQGGHPATTGTVDAAPDTPDGSTAGTGRSGFRLVRSRSDRMLGGVCGGVAAQLGIDPALLRIGLVALTILGAGAGAVLYVAAWVLAPEED